MLYGSTNFNKPSRFITELPKEHIELKFESTPLSSRAPAQPKAAQSFAKGGFGTNASSSYASKQAPKESYSIGDRVSHAIFGEGTVLKATVMSNDTMLEIAFEKVGTKKIMANFAKIKKI